MKLKNIFQLFVNRVINHLYRDLFHTDVVFTIFHHFGFVAGAALFKTSAPDLYGTLKESDHSLVMRDKMSAEIAWEILEYISNL